MRFLARGSLYDTNSLAEVRFEILYRQSSNTSRILKLVHYYVVIRSRTCRHWEISKKLTLNPTLLAKNTPLFLLSDMKRSLKILPEGCPYMLMYSALHIMQRFSHILDVHMCSSRKSDQNFSILHFYDIQTMSLTQDLK